MTSNKTMRLSQVARKLNVGTSTITDFLGSKGVAVENKPNTKITPDQFAVLAKEFQDSIQDKEEAAELTIGKTHVKNQVIDSEKVTRKVEDDGHEEEITITNIGSSAPSKVTKPIQNSPPPKEKVEKIESPKLQGIKVVGKIDLNNGGKKEVPKASDTKPVESSKPIVESKPLEPKVETVLPPKVEVVQKTEEKKPETIEKKIEKVEPPVVEKKPEVIKEEVVVPTVKVETPKVKAEDSSVSKEKQEDVPKVVPPVSKTPEVKASVPKKEQQRPVVKMVQAPVGNPKKETETTPPVVATPEKDVVIEAKAESLRGLKVLGKIELPKDKKDKKGGPVASSDGQPKKKKRKRVRIDKKDGKPEAKPLGPNEGNNRPIVQRNPQGARPGAPGGNRNDRRKPGGPQGKPGVKPGGKPKEKEEISGKEIQDKIRATIAKIGGGTKRKSDRSKYRRDKRQAGATQRERDQEQEELDAKILKVTEFVSANDLSSLMDVSVNEVISACMSLGMFVSINQRLDAETISIIAEEFGFEAEFTTAVEDEVEEEIEENEADLTERAPIVTIMGHVDHGKTSLLDYIRDAKVADKEAGGITQHIGAYSVKTDSGKRITFLDTPGHEAFTAMRARGAKVTDIVVLVVAADDRVMPQTKEAINHAMVAGVRIIIAINKVDKPAANPDKIREELSGEKILVEEWGGKYQCQEVSAKTGVGIDDLLEKILIEAELLELKANSKRTAIGTVVEATLDKGRGYLTTVLVQKGTLKIGDVMVAGAHYGRVKAMTDHRGRRLTEAGPSTPIQMLGLSGAPQAGDKIQVVETDRDAREITTKRAQLLREQSIRTKKHLTIEEIGRRLKIGSFKELNLIVKGDVDGSVEALTDSLLKLSTEEVQVNIIHKAVGAITESDVLLATASDAIILGFQVRPAAGAKRLAEQEEIEIRTYSIIYKAIEEIKDALEGLLEPDVEEIVVGNVQVREIFKISKIGTIAGCMVTDGYIKRNSKIRLVREGIVIFSGEIAALKRFKDDVSEVKNNYECGISLKNFNEIKMDDIIEAYEEREVKRTLK